MEVETFPITMIDLEDGEKQLEIRPIKPSSKARLEYWLGKVLTPEFDETKLKDVGLIVVHGGRFRSGVAAGMLMQDLVDSAKRKVQGLSFEEADLRPPILFTGLWAKDSTEESRPRNRKGEVVSEAEQMKQVALSWGLSEELILIEDKSQTTEENVVNSLKQIKEQGENPKTVLFISAQFFPRKAQLNWKHYGRDIKILPLGTLGPELFGPTPVSSWEDKIPPADSPKWLKSKAGRRNFLQELAKSTITLLRLKLKRR